MPGLRRQLVPSVRAAPTAYGGKGKTGDAYNVGNVIPTAMWGTVTRETLNRTARQIAETQLAVCAANEPLRFGWGRNRVGALLLRPVTYGANLLLPFIIGRGPINAITAIEFEGASLPSGMSSTTYLGTASPPVDPWLQAAWAAQSKVYADTLPGIAWGVVQIPPNENRVTGLTIEAQMLKVYDSRLDSTNGGSGSQRLADASTWTYSNNAALVLANYLTSSAYGKGETLDWSTVAAVADVCDQVLGGLKRRTVNLMVDTARDLDDVEEMLRAYAGCFIVREEVTRLVADAPASSVYLFTNASGSGANYLADSIRLTQRAQKDTPTLVTVQWTDTSVKPWAMAQWTEKDSGVDAGTTPWREQVISMPGIQDAGMARREALRRLNEYITSDLSATLVSTEPSIQLRRGDVVTVTDQGGLVAKPFRLIGHRPLALGRWAESLAEYDPLIYSDSVATAPTIPDTSFGSPSSPPAISGINVVEDVYQVATGLFGSRLIVTWTAPTYPFIDAYVVTVSQSGVLKDSAFVNAPSWVSKALTENLQYDVSVAVRSTVNIIGPSSIVSFTNNGKLAKPTDVVALDAFEINGEVRATVIPAVDVDLTGHEYRYTTAGGATDSGALATQWAAATLIDRVAAPSVRMVTKLLSAGSWRLLVKGLDSVRTGTYPFGQESVNAKYKDVTVTSDANAFLVASGSWTNPLLKKMVLHGNAWVTDFSDTWNSLFTAAMSTYTNALYTYHTAGTSSLLTEIIDVGASTTGDWRATASYSDLSGTAVPQLELGVGGEASKTIVGATTATPSSLNITTHGYAIGDEVLIAACAGTGDVAAKLNVRAWIGTVPDADHVTLVDFAGTSIGITGTYTASSGNASRWNWTPYTTLATKATARYVRLRLTTSGTQLVNNPIGTYQCNAIARPDGGFFTSVASGPTFVRFSQPFAKLKSLAVAASGATGGSAKYDKTEVSGGRMVQANANALRFTLASSQYVTCPDVAANRLTMPFTVEGWVRVSAASASAQVIVRKTTTAAATQNLWALQIRPQGTMRAAMLIAGGTFLVDTPYTLTDDAWHHGAMVWDANVLSLYVDGLLVGSVATSGTWTQPTSPVGIGANPPENGGGAWANFINGEIGEVRLWSAARTQAQIVANMSSRLVGNEANLVALYHLDATSGTSATDSTSTANTGTLTNGPSWRPLDGFDGYVFNSALAQIAGDASWNGSGV